MFSTVTISKPVNKYLVQCIRHYGKVGILGVPFEEGQLKKGVRLGPDAIRKFGILKDLQEIGNEVVDFGDVAYDLPGIDPRSVANVRNLSHIAASQKQTSARVAEILQQGYSCLSLGGDHSIAIGTIDGHIAAKKDVSVLWIDAHADLNTAATSPTGNVHGMSAGKLLKELADYWPYLPGMDWQIPQLSAKHLAYIGLRDLDGYERMIVEKFNILAFGMDDVVRYGITNVVSMALCRIDPANDRSLHVSFDIDALDPIEAPSTGTAVRGGLSLREGVQIMEDVYKTGRLNAIDLVEVNPSIGSGHDAKITVQAAQHLIKAALGLSRRGPMIHDCADIPRPET